MTRLALALLLVLPTPAAAFSSVDFWYFSAHDAVTTDALALLRRAGGAQPPFGWQMPERLTKLVQRVDGEEMAVSLFAPSTLVRAVEGFMGDILVTGRYQSSHHFDRPKGEPCSETFAAGMRWLADRWDVATRAEGWNARAAMVALGQAVHALQDVHAHSNIAELSTSFDASILVPAERARWPKIGRRLDVLLSPTTEQWYTPHDAISRPAVARLDACLGTWPPPVDCLTADKLSDLEAALVLTGFEPVGISPALPWCTSTEDVECYLRSKPPSQRENSERIKETCAGAWQIVRDELPTSDGYADVGDGYLHDCFAKDSTGYGVSGEPAKARKTVLYKRAAALASIRTAALLDATYAEVGKDRWKQMWREAGRLAAYNPPLYAPR